MVDFYAEAFFDRIMELLDKALGNPLPEFELIQGKKRYPWYFEDSHLAWRCPRFLDHFLKNYTDYYKAYSLLSDDVSKKIYVDILLLRIIGPKYINSPKNNPEYWDGMQDFYTKFIENQSIEIDRDIAGAGKQRRFTITFQNHKITLETIWYYVPEIYYFGQYRFNRNGIRIEPEKDDVVIDAGAYDGDSGLSFAASVGSGGFVYSFEIDPFNAKLMERNLELNPELARSIEIINMAITSTSKEFGIFNSRSASSKIETEIGLNSGKIRYISIDDFVAEKKLNKLDFIKLDIVGAELSALNGAKESLARFKPKLAICIYHNQDDFYSIINYLNSLGLNYEFYVDHYGISIPETVVYAKVKRGV